MTVSIPALPTDVLTMIADAVEAIKAEARRGARITEGRRLAVIRQDYVNRHGYEYRDGAAAALAVAVPDFDPDAPVERPEDRGAYWCAECREYHYPDEDEDEED